MKKNLIFIIVILIILAGVGIWYASQNGEEDLSPSPSPSLIAQVTYLCDDDRTIEAAFYKKEEESVEPGEQPIPSGSVKLVLNDGRSFDLPQTISADGGRYANSDESFIFWSKGDTAFVLENNIEKYYTGCVVVPEEGIIVVSPNGGEVWSKGKKVQILWRAAEEVESVNIRLGILSDGEGQSFSAAITSDFPNTGKYEWTVQDVYAEVLGVEDLPASDKYLVTVEDSQNSSVYDISDVVFTIKEITTDQACISSGGTVATAMCCKSTGDFPNTCLIGACGCSLENSHEVKVCDCGEGKCFNEEECIDFNLE